MHHNTNAHLLPVKQVSNADLLKAAQDSGHLMIIPVSFPSRPERFEMDHGTLDLGITHEHSEVLTEPLEPFLAEHRTEAELYDFYSSLPIGILRGKASHNGLKGAYKGPKKAELVEFCVVESKRLGVRV